MRKGFRLFLWTGLAALLTFLAAVNSASASEFKLLDFQEASLNYKKFLGARHWLVTSPQNELNLTLNTNFLHFLFWNNRVHSITDEANFAYVGWNYFLGIRVTRFLDVQYEHFSAHLLDGRSRDGWYPVEDSIGFKLFLYRDKSSGPAVFDVLGD